MWGRRAIIIPLLSVFRGTVHASRVRVSKHASNSHVAAGNAAGGLAKDLCEALDNTEFKTAPNREDKSYRRVNWKMAVTCEIYDLYYNPLRSNDYVFTVRILSPKGCLSTFVTDPERPVIENKKFTLPLGSLNATDCLKDLFWGGGNYKDYGNLQWELSGKLEDMNLAGQQKGTFDAAADLRTILYSVTLKHNGDPKFFNMKQIGNGCCTFKWEVGPHSMYFNEAMNPTGMFYDSVACVQACTNNPDCIASSWSKLLRLCFHHVLKSANDGASSSTGQLNSLLTWISEQEGAPPEGPEDLVRSVEASPSWPMHDPIDKSAYHYDCPNQACYVKNFQKPIGMLSETVFSGRPSNVEDDEENDPLQESWSTINFDQVANNFVDVDKPAAPGDAWGSSDWTDID